MANKVFILPQNSKSNLMTRDSLLLKRLETLIARRSVQAVVFESEPERNYPGTHQVLLRKEISEYVTTIPLATDEPKARAYLRGLPEETIAYVPKNIPSSHLRKILSSQEQGITFY